MQISPEIIWRAKKKELIQLLNTKDLIRKPKKVHFYVPSFMYYRTSYQSSSQFHFPTFSVTGTLCALDCKHCGGKILETMQPAETSEKLFMLAAKLKQKGALGCLVSGGCLSDGAVPLEHFLPAIAKIKHELNLTVFVHTGIIALDTAVALKKAGVDAALIDIIGSNETIKKIGNLNVTTEDYASSLRALQEANLNFVPHIIVGLHDGRLKGELDALKLISATKPSALVLIAFTPIPGTVMAKVKPPEPAAIYKVTAIARLMFPKKPLVLGCVRPKGKHRVETDVLALKAGADAIAFPSEAVIEYAKSHEYKFSFSSCCCAQVYMDDAFRSYSK